MSDGECMERMWSFLGKFANISKEMTPENRVDLLIDALVHYGERITHKQGNTLAEKLLKTAELKVSTSKLLEETLAPLTGLTSEDVKKWSLEEKESYRTNSDACLENKERLTPSESYALNLEKYIELSQSLMATENQLIKGDIKKKISSTEHLLKRYEVSNKVQRWPSSSDDFILNSAKQKETNTLFKKLQKLMAERTFLLQMMKKDACGQSISKRLNKQLQKVNQSITTLIKVYNEVESSKKPGPETLDFDSLKATITETAAMTTEMRRVLINLVDTLERCDEEDEMIRTEMKCVVNYYRMQHNAVMLSLSKSNSITMTSVLLSEGLNIERRMCHLNKMFSTGIVVPDVPLFFHKHAHLDNPYLESDVDDIINSLGADEDLLQDAENCDEQLDNDKELSESEDDSE